MSSSSLVVRITVTPSLASVDLPRRPLVAHKPRCALRAWCPYCPAKESARVGAGSVERDRDERAAGGVRDVVVTAGRVVDAVAAGAANAALQPHELGEEPGVVEERGPAAAQQRKRVAVE